MNQIAVLEDNPDLLDDVVFNLREAGYEVSGLGSIAALDAHLAHAQTDILVLDLGLPDGDGLEVSRRLRRTHPKLGIVMLTARTRLADKVTGLREGADVYLCKPIDMDELEAVVGALARRLGIAVGRGWKIDVRTLLLIPPNGIAISLTLPELHILQTLYDTVGQRASRKQLVEALGGNYLDFDERRLENIVSRLRRKIAVAQPDGSFLKALHGSGYIFTEPLEQV